MTLSTNEAGSMEDNGRGSDQAPTSAKPADVSPPTSANIRPHPPQRSMIRGEKDVASSVSTTKLNVLIGKVVDQDKTIIYPNVHGNQTPYP